MSGLVLSVYNAVSELPSGAANGTMAWIAGSTNTLYVSNGTGWYSTVLTNDAPAISSVTDASAGTSPFTLALDGTPSVITVTATDADETSLTYSYEVTSGTLGDTTVSQADNVFTITPSGSTGTFELTFTVSDGVDNTTSVASFAFPQAFDLIATGADGDSFASSGQYVFNDDGTEVTGMGSMGYTLATYALDTPYDVFNVSSRSSLRFVNPIPDHAYPFVYGLAFNGNGTKIFITDAEDGGTSGREINTYTLSTAYDISTMSSSPTATDNLYTSTGGASGEIEGLHFNNDGTRMFTWDQNGRRLIQWNMSLANAYTPGNASYVYNYHLPTVITDSGHSGNTNSIFSGTFNADGTRLYVADWSGVVYLIRLSTGFDLSTMSHTQGEFFDLTAYAEYPRGLTLNADETVLTVRAQGLSPATGNLYQFLVPTT